MSRTKSHSVPSSAMWSTKRTASSFMRSSIRLSALGWNQAAAMARYALWSGSSMWISVRSTCSLLDGQGLGGLGRQQRSRRAQEERVVAFDVHHVGVTSDRPEGPVARLVDPVHGRLPAQEGGGLVEALLVGVGRGVDEDPTRLADAQPRRARHAAPDLVLPLRSIP